MIKIIASDMDGTLVNSKKELPDNIFEIITKLYDNNITFIAASGRQYYNLLSLFEPVKDKMIFIAENGGLIMKDNQKLYSTSMDLSDIKDIIDAVINIPYVHPILCGEKAAYYVPDNDYFVKNAHMYFKKYQYVDNIYDAVSMDNIIKVSIFDTENAATNSYIALQSLCNRFKITLSSTNWIDLCDYSTNKGTAIKMIQKKLNIDYSETMAFGDYLNDTEMMEHASYSYAMANAHPNLKAICKYETLSNDENGVVIAINSLIKYL